MKKLITANAKTREQLANPFAEIPHQELVNHAGMADLRGNHRTVDLGNGYIKVEPIDESIVYFCPVCRRGEYCEMNEKIKRIQGVREKQ